MKGVFMQDWFNKHFSVADMLEIIVIALSIMWFLAYARSDIDHNTEWNKYQDSVFMRRDVYNAQLNAINMKLDALDKKIDQINQKRR